MKTLQQEYQLIKEGKGNKDHFLKLARNLFPEYITSGNDFSTTVSILRGKSLLSEGIGGVITQPASQPNWFKIFNKKISEAIGVKGKKEYGDQNEFEKIDKDVTKDLANQFNNNDPKNIDNLYGQSFLLGYLAEMGDPKNAKKTVDELKAIVAKNMAKDISYYHKNAFAGVKGIGYQVEAPGLGEPKAPKGKYRSSGYGDLSKTVKEGLNEAKKKTIGKDKLSEERGYLSPEIDDLIQRSLQANKISKAQNQSKNPQETDWNQLDWDFSDSDSVNFGDFEVDIDQFKQGIKNGYVIDDNGNKRSIDKSTIKDILLSYKENY